MRHGSDVADFAFATCLPGLEPAVKLGVADAQPDLRFAYSRPGLVTFKASGALAPDAPSPTPFARVWGRALGPARDPSDAAHQLAYSGATRVHVFARDPDAGAELAAWREAIALPSGPAVLGELVADVVVAAGEPAWLGLHVHDASRVAHAGGAIAVDVPAGAPSRAYAKVEEAIAWRELPIGPGDVALEIGAAPGGALYALARRGVEAWGVDTGDLAPHVAALPNVHHLRTTIGALRWEQLPAACTWLLVDVNLAPQVALHEVARIAPPLAATLRGAIVTLKLNDWSFVHDLPALSARVASLVPGAQVHLRHLPSNRRELCAVAYRGNG
jgi:23S rRNA (cytidine2498-2'-O)-methyltransferase